MYTHIAAVESKRLERGIHGGFKESSEYQIDLDEEPQLIAYIQFTSSVLRHWKGKEKWTAYKFTKNVYEVWMPKHFERICSAVDAFPSDVSFDLSQHSELNFPEQSGLSQDFGAQSLAQSSTGSSSGQAQAVDQSTVAEAADITPNTSMNDANDSGRFKRPRKNGRRARR